MVQDYLSEQWIKAGLKENDFVLVHSNIKRTVIKFRKKGIKITPSIILESFMNVIGSKGTLLLPTFNFDFFQNKFFNVLLTRSKMGSLTEFTRKKYNEFRSLNPAYSFVCLGKYSNEISKLDNYCAFSNESPFGILKKRNGKIAILDLDDQNSMTFYHYIEQTCRVDYRKFKKVKGICIDFSREKNHKTYRFFLRDLSKGVVTNVNPAGDFLWKEGLYNGDLPNLNSGLRVIKSNEMFDCISDLIKKGLAQKYLYSLVK